MNTIFSKKLLAVVISSLLVGLTTSHDAFAQSSNDTGSVTKVSKQDVKELKDDHDEHEHEKGHKEEKDGHDEHDHEKENKEEKDSHDEHDHEKENIEVKGESHFLLKIKIFNSLAI